MFFFYLTFWWQRVTGQGERWRISTEGPQAGSGYFTLGHNGATGAILPQELYYAATLCLSVIHHTHMPVGTWIITFRKGNTGSPTSYPAFHYSALRSMEINHSFLVWGVVELYSEELCSARVYACTVWLPPIGWTVCCGNKQYWILFLLLRTDKKKKMICERHNQWAGRQATC